MDFLYDQDEWAIWLRFGGFDDLKKDAINEFKFACG